MSNTPSKAEIEALAQQHLKAFVQFSLGDVWFEGEVEFARAVLAKWAAPQQEAQEPAVDDPNRWFTVVYRDISPDDEARLLAEHPKASAMSWSHAIRDRAAARAVLAKWGTQPQAGAVPQGWKAVPVNPTPEMWKAAKSVPDPNPPYPPHYGLVWDAMLAASPTPPAEQAAPKAAPGVVNSVFDRQTAADFLSGKTVSDEAVRKFVQASREAEIALLKKALMEAEAAPRQGAQEPVAYVHVPHYTVEGKVRPVVSFEKYQQDYADGIYSTRIPLYTAPQPAPAPLSDDTKRLNWLLWKLPGDALRYVVGELSDTSSGTEFRAAIDAALAAKGGKV